MFYGCGAYKVYLRPQLLTFKKSVAMRIGFDAKRAFQNSTGLGHYSRTLLTSLARYYPGNEYYLFAPKQTTSFARVENSFKIITPTHFPFSLFRSAWRSRGVVKDLKKNKIDLYHGLSHEIPVGIQAAGIPSVVTMHDLIFERFPQQYNKIDVIIYRKKFKHACKHANSIIAISQQTKDDLINIYNIPAAKIDVCYQSCDASFREKVSLPQREVIRQLYQLPPRFFLSVGSIIERKNLLTICKAMLLLKERLNIPLVVIGKGGAYKQRIQKFIEENDLQHSIIFLSDNAEANSNEGFKSSAHFPTIYQMAEALLYPSTFEGFGIPILEALSSGVPVITSNVSCMPEAGGNAAAYIDPYDAASLSLKMEEIATDKNLAEMMIQKGLLHAASFSNEKTAAAIMQVYKKLVP